MTTFIYSSYCLCSWFTHFSWDQSHSSSHATSEEPIDQDVLAVSLDVSSVNFSEVPKSTDVCIDASTVDGNDVALISNNDPLTMSLSSLPCPDDTQISPTRQLDDTSTLKSMDWRMICQSVAFFNQMSPRWIQE
ncbi:hypothetical protein EZV62_004489 [Acer yangbiense]|uniref:Uncharacterized protein n=1 Tax=Acer yangbiense TaxID=1000413 RepID=A0A5C7IL20_9ROSI|nr:hypothetical protein EZV62_004489 [Acer yangbiense]